MKWKVWLALAAVILVGIICCRFEENERRRHLDILVDGSGTGVSPDAYERSGNYAGGFWDSGIGSLPCVQAGGGEEITLLFPVRLPAEVSLMKYDVHGTNAALGAAGTLDNAQELEWERRENGFSFPAPEFHADCQLIRCACTWRFLWFEKNYDYVFALTLREGERI